MMFTSLGKELPGIPLESTDCVGYADCCRGSGSGYAAMCGYMIRAVLRFDGVTDILGDV